MKQKITIGLMVFFLGILITACGKKSNNGGGTTNPRDYVSFGDIRISDDCHGRCEQVEQATFYIDNKDEYAALFIGDIGSHAEMDLDIFDPDFGTSFLARLLNPSVNALATCGSASLTKEVLEKILNARVRAECEIINTNRRIYDNLRDSYSVNVQFNFDNRVNGNGIYSVSIDIDREGRRSIVEFNRRQNDRLFYDAKGNALEINRDTIYITSRSGRVGYIKK